jgi:hypothetical protein
MGVRTRRRVGAPLKRDTAAGLVRDMIWDGTLRAGSAAPSAAALARETGYSVVTCRAALRSMLDDGTLRRGASHGARLRVAPPAGGAVADGDALRLRLSAMLAARRRAAGLTQHMLAALLGVSVTTIGHAETGRVWQARGFWQRAGGVLGDDAGLLRLYDDFKVAESCPPPADPPAAAEPSAEPGPLAVLPSSVAITAAGVLVTWPDGTQALARPPSVVGAAPGPRRQGADDA